MMLTYMNPSRGTVPGTRHSDESVKSITFLSRKKFTSVTLVPLTEDLSTEQAILH